MEEKNTIPAKDKIKILELTDAYYPTVDGVVSVVKNYALDANKTDVCVVAGPKPAKKTKYNEADDFEVIRCLSIKAPEEYRCALPELDRKFVKKIKDEHFDILHTHSPFLMGRIAIKIGKKQRIPVVATLHTQYHRDFDRVLKSKFLTKFMIKRIMFVYNRVNSVWTVSETSKKYLRMYGYKGDITVIRNGTDFVYPDNPEQLIERVNNEYGLRDQKNVFLFVGRLAKYKNIPLMLESMKILKEKNIDFKMVLVGGGFDEKEIKEDVEKMGLTDKCLFTGMIKDRDLLQGFYLRSDLYLFPSTFDMASVSQVEAAVHKLPSVVVENTCSSEQIVDGENGFVSKEDANCYAEKILQAIGDKDKLKIIAENAKATLSRSWADVGKDMMATYKNIIREYNEKELKKKNKK